MFAYVNLYNNIACIFCSGDSRYADKWYQSCVRDGWQQLVAKERADYTSVSIARKSSTSQQNCHASERMVSDAEQLFMLASAQTTSFPEHNGFVEHRSSSRDSGLGKESDSGSCSCNIQMPGPSTQTPDRNCQYIEDPESSRHPSNQLSSQPPNQPVCTVLPMRNGGRNASQCDAPRYPNSEAVQQEAFRQLNECEVFTGRSPQLAQKHRQQPEFSDVSARNGKQHWGQRFPIAQNVACYGNVVNPLRYSASHMPSARQASRCRVDASGQPTAAMYGCSRGREVGCVPPDLAAVTQQHYMTGTSTRMSMFDYSSGQDVCGRLAPAKPQDKLSYRERHNVNVSCRSAVDLQRDSADIARYHSVQQRYQPYDISAGIRHGNSAMPHGGSQHLFHPTSPCSLMQLRQNNELFYDSHISGIR